MRKKNLEKINEIKDDYLEKLSEMETNINKINHNITYPPFACQCCGFTNADIFREWFIKEHEYREPTSGDWDALDSYYKIWKKLKELEGKEL